MANVAGYLTPRTAMADAKMNATVVRDCDSRPCDAPTISTSSQRDSAVVPVEAVITSVDTTMAGRETRVAVQLAAGAPRKRRFIPVSGG